MATFVSPGNYVIEKDISDYIPSLNSSVVGVVGFGSRGPVDKPTLVTDAGQLIEIFGDPRESTGGQGLWGATQILDRTNAVYYVRCATAAANAASAVLPVGACPAVGVSANDQSAGVLQAFMIDVYEGSTKQNDTPYVVAAASGDASAVTTNVEAAVNQYLPTDAPFTFIRETSSIGYFLMNKPGADNWLNIRGYAVSSSAAGQDPNMNYFSGIGASVAAGGGGLPLNSNAGTLNQPTESTLATQSSWNGGNGYWTSAIGYGCHLQGMPGISLASITGDSEVKDAWLQGNGTMKVTNTDVTGAATLFVASSVAGFGNTLSPSAADGGVAVLRSLHSGKGYNYRVSSLATGEKTFGMQVISTAKQGKNNTVNINNDGATAESYLVDSKNTGLDDKFYWKQALNTKTYGNDPDSDLYYVSYATLDTSGTAGNVSGTSTQTFASSFSGTVTASAYNYVSGGYWTDGGSDNYNLQLATAVGTQSLKYVKLGAGTVNFAGGVNGDPGDHSNSLTNAQVVTALIGDSSKRSGMQGFRDDTLNIGLGIIPGITTQSVQNNLVSLAESTQNYLAVLSPPQGLNTTQEAINWTNGVGDGRTASLNSSWASIYWPWVKTFNTFTAADEYLDPGVFGVRQMAYTDAVSDPWFAPAGLTRGRLTTPTDVEVVLTQGDRDRMYGDGNVINPIVKFPQDGLVIFGQRTAQRTPTALDRINVRRMMIVLRKQILNGTRRFVFEPNDAITRKNIVDALKPTLQDIKDRRGITAFHIICDESVNTPARIDRNELWCKVIVQPTKTAEIIVFEINVTNQTGGIAAAS